MENFVDIFEGIPDIIERIGIVAFIVIMLCAIIFLYVRAYLNTTEAQEAQAQTQLTAQFATNDLIKSILQHDIENRREIKRLRRGMNKLYAMYNELKVLKDCDDVRNELAIVQRKSMQQTITINKLTNERKLYQRKLNLQTSGINKE